MSAHPGRATSRRFVRGEGVTYSALLPYLGPEAAAAERRRLLEGRQVA